MEKGEKPANSSSELLLLLLKHANHDKVNQALCMVRNMTLTNSTGLRLVSDCGGYQ